MLTPMQSQRYAYLVRDFNEEEFYAYYKHLSEGGRVEDFFENVEKHGEHDQQTHGSWANGELSDEQKGVVSAWTSLSNKSSWRQIANDLSEGKTPNASEDDIKTVKTLVDAIKQNSVIPAEALGRAELLTTGLRWQGALPKVGDSLKNELSSATLDERTSERFSQYSDFGGSKGKPVIFHYGFQTKGLDVNRAGADAFADEQEWLVSGTFKITDKYSENGITHLNLKPIDSVKKHESHDQKTHGSWASGNYDNLADWFKDEIKVFESETDKEVYFMEKLFSQRLKGFTEMAHPEFAGAISAYESNLSYEINEALRDPQISDDGYKSTIDLLDRAIDTAPPLRDELVAYRGVNGDGSKFFETLKVGDIWEDKGYTSTTIDAGVAQQFGMTSMQGLVFRMKLPAGTKGIFPSGYHEPMYGWTPSMTEAEFLMPRGSKFKIVAKRGKVWDIEFVP